jgi:hypothetical protein
MLYGAWCTDLTKKAAFPNPDTVVAVDVALHGQEAYAPRV